MHSREAKKCTRRDPQDGCGSHKVESVAVPIDKQPKKRAEQDRQDLLPGREITGHGLGIAAHENDVGRVDAEAAGRAALQELCGGEHEVGPG